MANKRDVNKPKHHSRDVFHAWMLEGASYAGPLDMPVLESVHVRPNRLVAFSDAMDPSWKDFDCFVHFFEDDSAIECFWHNPRAYIPKLEKFDGVIGLDYSVCWDFPVPLKEWNHFRNSASTYWLQQRGLIAVPQGRCEPGNYLSVLAGFPKHSAIAIGARSMVRRREDRAVLKESVRLIVNYLEPTCLIWYGSTMYGVTDYPLSKGIPVYVYPGKGRGKLTSHKEAC